MRIEFNNLTTSRKEVEIKADDYTSVYYDVDEVLDNGVELNSDLFYNLDKIQIGTSKSKPSFTFKQRFFSMLNPSESSDMYIVSAMTTSEFEEYELFEDKYFHVFYLTDFDWEKDIFSKDLVFYNNRVVIPYTTKRISAANLNFFFSFHRREPFLIFEGTTEEFENILDNSGIDLSETNVPSVYCLNGLF